MSNETANRLRQALGGAGISPDDLAQETGLPVESIARFLDGAEIGQAPKKKTGHGRTADQILASLEEHATNRAKSKEAERKAVRSAIDAGHRVVRGKGTSDTVYIVSEGADARRDAKRPAAVQQPGHQRKS